MLFLLNAWDEILKLFIRKITDSSEIIDPDLKIPSWVSWLSRAFFAMSDWTTLVRSKQSMQLVRNTPLWCWNICPVTLSWNYKIEARLCFAEVCVIWDYFIKLLYFHRFDGSDQPPSYIDLLIKIMILKQEC